MTKTRTMYLHTLDGQPATFDPLWQIIHRVPESPRWQATLVDSIERIRQERALSRRNLKSEGRTPGRWFIDCGSWKAGASSNESAMLTEVARLTHAHERAVREKEDAMHRAYIAGYLDSQTGSTEPIPDCDGYERLRAIAEGHANAYVKARPRSPLTERAQSDELSLGMAGPDDIFES